MSAKTHRRSRLLNKTAAAALALLLGGGGLAAANVYANAGSSSQDRDRNTRGQGTTGVSTIVCPEVANALPEVPRQARQRVDRDLAKLDSQVARAYQQLRRSDQRVQQDPGYVDDAILAPLRDRRAATIGRIDAALAETAPRSSSLRGMAGCQVRENVPEPDRGQGQRDGGGGQFGGRNNGQNGGRDDNRPPGEGDQGGGQPGGPAPEDFVDITDVQPNVPEEQAGRGASTGTFTTECGRNENGLFNPDNVIVAPGVSNGAHHMHDYVGNQGNDAFASDEDLANADTSCVNQDDKSSYFWPVLRLQNGQNERDADQPGGGQDGNVGQILTPSSVTLSFEGNAQDRVSQMPRFLRVITGDAKAFTGGTENANASWSCTGFEDRQLTDKYPICPDGSEVVRTFRFQSCWDGQNTDSANHRTHVAFADRDGRCQDGFQPIPQMVQRLTYDVPSGPGFAVDSFPEQLHKPVTDHSDFINVMSDGLMKRVTNCINSGRDCTN